MALAADLHNGAAAPAMMNSIAVDRNAKKLQWHYLIDWLEKISSMHSAQKITAAAVLVTCLVMAMIGLCSSVCAANYSLISSGRHLNRLQPSGARPEFPTAARWRAVDLAPSITAPGSVVVGDTLGLDLFSDAVYSARVDRVTTNVNGTVTVRGRIEGNPLAYALISTTENRSLVEIDLPEKNQRFFIQSDTSGNHYLTDVSGVDLGKLEDVPSPVPPVEALSTSIIAANAAPSAVNGPLDPATVDVMIVYTPAARIWADASGGGIANFIAQAMAKGQLACDNSNTILTLRLAYSAEISYTESGTADTDLNRLTNTTDGYMDEVHTWRNNYSADIVTLLARVEDVGGSAGYSPRRRDSLLMRSTCVGFSNRHGLTQSFMNKGTTWAAIITRVRIRSRVRACSAIPQAGAGSETMAAGTAR